MSPYKRRLLVVKVDPRPLPVQASEPILTLYRELGKPEALPSLGNAEQPSSAVCTSKDPCTYMQYILWLESTYIGTTLRPKYILYGHMDP